MPRSRPVRLLAAVALVASALVLPAAMSANAAPAVPANAPSQLGPNVYVFTPSMPQAQIQQTVDAIAAQQVDNQFGTQRYALLFMPGTYGSTADPLRFQVGYYTEVAGLGAQPSDVVINGSIDVYNQCDTTGCYALNNFWRSLSNLTIDVAGGEGCQANTEFWAVSQASPMRRVQVNGNTSLMDYCSAGPQYASGGFIADSKFAGNVVNGSQQQYLVRNSDLDGWSNGVWNQVFLGDNGAPPTNFVVGSDAGPYTTVDQTPVSRERPFLYSDGHGYRVFVPSTRRNSVGPSWTAGGRSLPLSSFFVATPSTSILTINAALLTGKNLLLTPGVYKLALPITVLRPNTVVLGLGLPTLIPQYGLDAIDVANVSGVSLAGLTLDAGPRNSDALVRVGLLRGVPSVPSDGDPTALFDVFFRVGGASAGKVTNGLVVNSSNVILDDTWIWRADHGSGVGWTSNTAATGLLVNGDDVAAYGLAVEHFQKTEVAWNGTRGTVVFFQNEMPYDVPSQQAWMQSPSFYGYPAFQVTAPTFTGYGMGSYSFFNQGLPIHATQAFTVPKTQGISMNDLITVYLNGDGGIDSVIDGVGAPVNPSTTQTSTVLKYPA